MILLFFSGIFHWHGMLIIVAISLILTILALIDIVRSKFEGELQLIWVLIVVLFSLIGPILYFLFGRKQKILP